MAKYFPVSLFNGARRIARFWFHYLEINEKYKYGNIE
jgi:hypothetical protein